MTVNLSNLANEEFQELSKEIELHHALRDVLAWARSKPKDQVHPHTVAEVITQDEYTHDVIVPYRDVFLVYDTT